MTKAKSRSKLITTSIAAILLQFLVPQLASFANAATPGFLQLMVREDRMAASVNTGLTVCAETPASATGLGSEASVTIAIPSATAATTNFFVDTTASDWKATTTNLPADPNSGGPTTSSWPGVTAATISITAGSTVAGITYRKYVTLTAATVGAMNLAASSFYCFNLEPSGVNPIITNPTDDYTGSLIGQVTTDTSTPTAVLQTGFAFDVVANDQVVVTAVVPPIFTMDINNIGNGHTGDINGDGFLASYTGTDAFLADLSLSSAVATSGVDVEITTNAPNGWETWVQDAYSGLKSVLAGGAVLGTVSPGTPASVSSAPGSPQYGAYGVISSTGVPPSCSPTIDPIYTGSVGANNVSPTFGTLLDSQFLHFADCGAGQPATSPLSNTAQDTRFQMYEEANINPTVPAAPDYTDTITMVGAGNF